MLKKGDEITTSICDIGSNLEGIARHDKLVIFVKGAIVGEVVRVKLIKVTTRLAYAKLLQIITRSVHRQEPLCKYYDKCGGCHGMHMDIECQLRYKRLAIIGLLSKHRINIGTDNTYSGQGVGRLEVGNAIEQRALPATNTISIGCNSDVSLSNTIDIPRDIDNASMQGVGSTIEQCALPLTNTTSIGCNSDVSISVGNSDVSLSNTIDIPRDKDKTGSRGGIQYDDLVGEVISLEPYRGYRNKTQLPIGVDKAGNVCIGFFREGSHDIVAIDGCTISSRCSELISAVKEYIALSGDKPYFGLEHTGGNLRHVVMRVLDNATSVIVVVDSGRLVDSSILVDCLTKRLGRLSLYTSHNASNTNVVLGTTPKHIYGDKDILCTASYDIGEANAAKHIKLQYRLRADAFLQVNDVVAKAIYTRVASLIASSDCTHVIDAYSGIGLMSAIIASSGTHVTGIEISPASVACANDIVRLNNINSLVNICDDTNVALPKLLLQYDDTDREPIGNKLGVVLDPPRKGCDIAVLEALNNSRSTHLIVYISCNPQTLVRDIGVLSSSYRLDYIQPYDMFVYTKHVESVAVLYKNN